MLIPAEHRNAHKKLKLPRLEKVDAIALNRLYASCPVPCGASQELVWARKPGPFAERAWLEIAGNGRSAWLLIDSTSALGHLLQGPISHMPEIDRVLAVEAYCADLLDTLEVSFGFALDVVKAGLGSRSELSQSLAVDLPHSAASLITAEFTWRGEPLRMPVHCQLRMPFDWLTSYREPVNAARASQGGALPIGLSLQCGWSDLSVSELAQLQPGGWLRLRNTYGTENGWLRRLLVCSPDINWHLWADIDQASRLLVVPGSASTLKPSADTMNLNTSLHDDVQRAEQEGSEDPSGADTHRNMDDPKPADTSPRTALAGLTLRVAFEVGTADIPLNALLELKPGYSIELNRPIDPMSVRLMVNGGELATGELTDIGGVLGVVITSVHGQLLRN